MAGNIKGITIEINGDTTKLDKALTGVNKQTTAVNKELRQVDNLLKFNPGNTELVAQKQQLLAKQVEQTSSKLKTLKEAQAQVEAQFKAGDIGEDQYRAFQREVVATEGKLDHFSGQLKDTEAFLKENESAASLAAAGFSKAAVKAKLGADGVESLGDKADQANDKLDEIANNTFAEKAQSIGDAFSEMGDKIQEIGEGALESAKDVDSATSQFNNAFGLTGKAASETKDLIINLFNSGIVESYGEAEEALQQTKQQMKDLNGQDLSKVAGQAVAFSKTFDSDMNESLRGANALMENYGLSAEDAFNLMTTAAQRGLNKSDELGDNLAEYTGQFAQAGYSAQDMFAILESGLDGGAYNFDKVNDLIKEFGIRMSDGSIDAAVKDMGGNFSKLWADIKKGGKSPQEAFQILAGEVNKLGSNQKKAAAISALFGSQGEDAGLKVVAAMGNVNGKLGETKKAYEDTAGKAAKLAEASDTQGLQSALNDLKSALIPIGTDLLTALKPVVDFVKQVADQFAKLPEPVRQFIEVFGGVTVLLGILAPIIAAVMTIGSTVSLVAIGIAAAIAGVVLIFKNWGTIVDWFKGIWAQMQPAMQPFMGALSALKPVLDVLKQFFMNTFDNIKMAINGFVTFSKGLLDILVGIFTGNGEKIKQGFGKAFQGLITIGASILSQLINTVGSLFGAIVNTVSAGAKGAVAIAKSIFGGIVQVITHPIETAKNLFGKAIDAIKGFFNFKFSWPHIPLPSFGINPKGWKIGDLLKGKIPSLSVAWHAAGGIFNKPTLFAGGDGSLHGVGEAGAEAVAPLDKLMGYVQQAVANVMQNKDDAAQLALLEAQNSLLAKMLDELVNGIPAYVDWQAGARRLQPEIERLTNTAARTRNRRLGNV